MNATSRTLRGIVGVLTATALFAMPAFAAAETASVATRQVLPQGGNMCAPVFVSDVRTFVYDGELQSFEIVVSDPAYVGVFGKAGDVAIPFNYMSRRIEPNGALRLHIDTTVNVQRAVPVTVTLLSSIPGQPTCITTVTFTANGDGSVTTENPTTSAVPGSVSGTSHGGQGSVKGSSTSNSGKPVVGTTSATSTSIVESIVKACSENGAYQLWFILLAIFFVIAAFVGLSQPPLTEKHTALPSILIAVPLAALLAFWYFIPDCRLNWFIPVILLVAAAIGIYSAYRTTPTPPKVNSAVMVLPPKKGEEK